MSEILSCGESGSKNAEVIEQINTNTTKNIFTTSTMTDLLAVDKSIYKSVNVKGYHAENDGGGDVFNWDSSINKSTANAGTIIDPSVSLANQGTGVGTGCWIRQYGDSVNALWFGIDNTGANDVTEKLGDLFSNFSDIIIPDGDYLIIGTGSDSGGIVTTVSTSIKISCGAKARFFTDSLDNSMITMSLPSGIMMQWTGGYFDMSNMKVSTSVPFPIDYPPVNQGASAITDGLYIVGDDTNVVSISNVKFQAGIHWETAGGDSAINVGITKQTIIQNCIFIGIRDLGVYISSNSTGTGNSSATVRDCRFINCFGGVGLKRSVQGADISGNSFLNCVRSVNLEKVIGLNNFGTSITNNFMENCGLALNATFSSGVNASNNTLSKSGCTIASGATEDVVAKGGFSLKGVINSTVSNNSFLQVNSLYSKSLFSMLILEPYNDGTDAQDTVNNILSNNVSDSWGQVTNTVDSSSVNNAFLYNVAKNADIEKVSGSLVDNIEITIESSSFTPLHMTPSQYNSSAYGAATIQRRGQPTVGVLFNTNLCSLSGGHAGTMLNISNVGTGFNSKTAIAKPSITGSRASTEQALAQLLQAFDDYGLITDNTTA